MTIPTGNTQKSDDDAKGSLRTLMDERDVRYMEKFESIERSIVERLQAIQRVIADSEASSKELTAALFNAATTAVLKAEAATERRFDGVNEFRAVLTSQQATLVTRPEVDARFKSVEEKVDRLQNIGDRDTARTEFGKERKQDIQILWPILLAALAVVLSVVIPWLQRAK